MVPITGAIKHADYIDATYTEKDSLNVLHAELAKGIHSAEKGDVYTIEEAWEVIDKI